MAAIFIVAMVITKRPKEKKKTYNDANDEKKLGTTDRQTDRRTEWVIESRARD